MVPLVVKIKEYIDEAGRSLFTGWFEGLDGVSAAKVTTALYRLEQGNFSNVKGVGGVLEYKIDFGPGYRIYFAKDGDELIILLGGGSKKRQDQDIKLAKKKWNEYKERKRK